MTTLAQAVATLPESQLVKMVSSLVGDQIAGLIHSSLHSRNSAKEVVAQVERIRNLEVVQLLPGSNKQKIHEMCDKALEIVELVPSI
jgi:hypothetical protein